jgi:hypothetical protein
MQDRGWALIFRAARGYVLETEDVKNICVLLVEKAVSPETISDDKTACLFALAKLYNNFPGCRDYFKTKARQDSLSLFPLVGLLISKLCCGPSGELDQSAFQQNKDFITMLWFFEDDISQDRCQQKMRLVYNEISCCYADEKLVTNGRFSLPMEAAPPDRLDKVQSILNWLTSEEPICQLDQSNCFAELKDKTLRQALVGALISYDAALYCTNRQEAVLQFLKRQLFCLVMRNVQSVQQSAGVEMEVRKIECRLISSSAAEVPDGSVLADSD